MAAQIIVCRGRNDDYDTLDTEKKSVVCLGVLLTLDTCAELSRWPILPSGASAPFADSCTPDDLIYCTQSHDAEQAPFVVESHMFCTTG